jgi:two-component sensor histidine kinase
MGNAFEELRQRIDKKEREMLGNCDSFLERNLQEVESFVRLIQGRCMTLNQTSEHLTQTLKTLDEAQLLAFYAANYHKLEASCLESDIPQLLEVPNQVKLKC